MTIIIKLLTLFLPRKEYKTCSPPRANYGSLLFGAGQKTYSEIFLFICLFLQIISHLIMKYEVRGLKMKVRNQIKFKEYWQKHIWHNWWRYKSQMIKNTLTDIKSIIVFFFIELLVMFLNFNQQKLDLNLKIVETTTRIQCINCIFIAFSYINSYFFVLKLSKQAAQSQKSMRPKIN